MKYLLAFLALFAPAAAFASDVSLSSEVFVERIKEDAQGRKTTVLEEPKVVTPGDKLVFILSYKNEGAQPADDFVVTNPIPEAVAFAGDEDAGAVVSIDGAKSWGALAALKVRQTDGTERAATPADVTHIRWSFAQPIPVGKQGKLSFRGIVR
jgi:uncharacterized repeat protein (TIGR01451 family)